MSSGIETSAADMTISPHGISEFYVISKLLAVDTEVDPPEQNSRRIRLRAVFSLKSTKNLFSAPYSRRTHRNRLFRINRSLSTALFDPQTTVVQGRLLLPSFSASQGALPYEQVFHPDPYWSPRTKLRTNGLRPSMLVLS